MNWILRILLLLMISSCGTKAKLANELAAKQEGKALMSAVRSNSFEELKRLVNLGYDIHYKDEDDDNLLNFAASYASLEINEYLITQGVDVNNKNDDSWTPLNRACRYNRVGIIKLYMKYGVDLNVLDVDPIYNSIKAARPGLLEIITLLIDYGYDLNNSITDNVHMTIAYDMVDALKLIVEKGANLNRKYDDNGWSYLHWASYYQAPACAKYLMQFDVLNVKTYKDYTSESVYFGNEVRTVLFPAGIFAVDIAKLSGNDETYKILQENEN